MSFKNWILLQSCCLWSRCTESYTVYLCLIHPWKKRYLNICCSDKVWFLNTKFLTIAPKIQLKKIRALSFVYVVYLFYYWIYHKKVALNQDLAKLLKSIQNRGQNLLLKYFFKRFKFEDLNDLIKNWLSRTIMIDFWNKSGLCKSSCLHYKTSNKISFLLFPPFSNFFWLLHCIFFISFSFFLLTFFFLVSLLFFVTDGSTNTRSRLYRAVFAVSVEATNIVWEILLSRRPP